MEQFIQTAEAYKGKNLLAKYQSLTAKSNKMKCSFQPPAGLNVNVNWPLVIINSVRYLSQDKNDACNRRN